jgi:hypothetical protein
MLKAETINTSESSTISGKQKWLTLTGTWMSWLFDSMDAGLYAFVIAYLVKDFNSSYFL